MPNWVENKLEIYGDTEVLIKIQKLLCSEDRILDFNKIIPESKIEYLDEYGGVDISVLDWRRKNWGCKWNAGDSQIISIPGTGKLVYIFNTPWCIPDAFFYKLAQDFDNCNFEIYGLEEGIESVTYIHVKEGDVVEECHIRNLIENPKKFAEIFERVKGYHIKEYLEEVEHEGVEFYE